jgi:hypothetical protein
MNKILRTLALTSYLSICACKSEAQTETTNPSIEYLQPQILHNIQIQEEKPLGTILISAVQNQHFTIYLQNNLPGRGSISLQFTNWRGEIEILRHQEWNVRGITWIRGRIPESGTYEIAPIITGCPIACIGEVKVRFDLDQSAIEIWNLSSRIHTIPGSKVDHLSRGIQSSLNEEWENALHHLFIAHLLADKKSDEQHHIEKLIQEIQTKTR